MYMWRTNLEIFIRLYHKQVLLFPNSDGNPANTDKNKSSSHGDIVSFSRLKCDQKVTIKGTECNCCAIQSPFSNVQLTFLLCILKT